MCVREKEREGESERVNKRGGNRKREKELEREKEGEGKTNKETEIWRNKIEIVRDREVKCFSLAVWHIDKQSTCFSGCLLQSDSHQEIIYFSFVCYNNLRYPINVTRFLLYFQKLA